MNSFRNFGEDKLNELLLVYSKIITIVNSYTHPLFYKKKNRRNVRRFWLV